MAAIGDGFKNIFLAGIGAMAITAEKGKELVDQLVAKGEITVEQGKQINTELKHKAASTVAGVRDDLLEAHMKTMTPEERAAFLERAAEIAAKVDACAVEVEGEVVHRVSVSPDLEGRAAEPEVHHSTLLSWRYSLTCFPKLSNVTVSMSSPVRHWGMMTGRGKRSSSTLPKRGRP